MLETLALAGLSAGMSALSGMGNAQATAKQGRQQQINDAIAAQRNNDAIEHKNKINRQLGEHLLGVQEVTTENTTGTVRNTVHHEKRITDDQSNYSYVDVDGMMAAAERAGFNPKTWLDAGAMQAYTQTGSHRVGQEWEDGFDEKSHNLTVTTTKTGHNAVQAMQLMSPESALVTASQAVKVPSMLSIIGDAGTAGLNTFNQLNAKEQAGNLQRELLERQIQARADLASKTGRNSGGMAGTPSYSSAGGSSSGATGATTGASGGGYQALPSLVGSFWPTGGGKEDERSKFNKSEADYFALSGLPYPHKWGVGEVKRTNPYWGDWRVSGASDAAAWEERGGEVMAAIAGLGITANDATLNLTGRTIPEWGGRFATVADQALNLQRRSDDLIRRGGTMAAIGDANDWLYRMQGLNPNGTQVYPTFHLLQ